MPGKRRQQMTYNRGAMYLGPSVAVARAHLSKLWHLINRHFSSKCNIVLFLLFPIEDTLISNVFTNPGACAAARLGSSCKLPRRRPCSRRSNQRIHGPRVFARAQRRRHRREQPRAAGAGSLVCDHRSSAHSTFQLLPPRPSRCIPHSFEIL